MDDATITNIYTMLSNRRKDMREEIYVSCWHMNEHESVAMWKQYSQSSDSVCIQTTYSKLASLLPSWVHMGLVDYIDYELGVITESNLFVPFLRKRKSFEHEHEVRAIVWALLGETAGGKEARASVSGEGAKIEIDLNSLIECVYVSPIAALLAIVIMVGSVIAKMAATPKDVIARYNKITGVN
jgi:hypothetical protein